MEGKQFEVIFDQMFPHSTATLVFPLIIALARKIHICTGAAQAECLIRLGTLPSLNPVQP